jgi:RimJ/RimL family protein N-acetyltransferase
MPPTLTTARLILRPPVLEDAPAIASLAADRRITDTTATLPHPYTLADAEWFVRHVTRPDADTQVWAIVRAADQALSGVIGLHASDDLAVAELGYWVGVPFWGQGIATEAAHATLDHGFRTRGLEVVFADHLARNPASHRVMEKLGMAVEGVRRRRLRKWGVLEDLCGHAVLAEEWLGRD